LAGLALEKTLGFGGRRVREGREKEPALDRAIIFEGFSARSRFWIQVEEVASCSAR